jgi:hypothetical protein
MTVLGAVAAVARVFASVTSAAPVPSAPAAQSGTSTITGIVTDATGGTIPAAQVTIMNEQTGVGVETVTNGSGVYRVGALVPGVYRIEIELAGFEQVVRRAAIDVGQTLTVDAVLEIGRQSEAVDVSVGIPLVESQTSTLAQTVTREMVAVLPLANRAASSLVALAPGVVMVDTGAGTVENYPLFSVAGGRARNQSFIEAYNLLNHPNFNIPGFVLGAADFGVVTSARPARTIQLGSRLSF